MKLRRKIWTLGAATAALLSCALAEKRATAQDAAEKPKAERVDPSALPEVMVPKGYEEGYLPKLSEIDIKEVEQFAKNSSADLNDLLELISKVPDYWEKRAMLKSGIDAIIVKSKPLKTELLMRNVLERAVILVNLIDAEVQNDLKRKGVIDQEVRLMKESIRLALKYWEPYLKHVNGQTATASVDLAKINYRDFGLAYSNLLWSIANSIFDASAEYKLRFESLKLLMWDLYRDENKLETGQAGAISKLYTLVRNASDPAQWSDDEYVERIKLLRIVRNEAFKRLGVDPGPAVSQAVAAQASAAKAPAAQPGGSVALYQSDSCSGALVAFVGPETGCDAMARQNLPVVYATKIDGRCHDIVDTSFATACTAFKSGLQGVRFYQSDSCSGGLIASVPRQSDCDALASRGLPVVYAVMINGSCQDIVDSDFKSACNRFAGPR